MARQPAQTVVTDQKITGQDAIWTAIRAVSHPFTLTSVLDHMHSARRPRLAADRRTVTGYLDRLTAAGILTADGDSYRLPLDPGPKAPRVRKDGSVVEMGAGRRAIWRSIRIQGQFTLNDLVRLGSTEDVTISRIDAKYYVGWLVRAGYVIVVDRPAQTSQPTMYRLVPSKSTGPMPPQVQRAHTLYDPNIRRVVWEGEGECL